MKVPLPERASTDLHYDDADYTDAGSLERELRRVAEICHQCRRCLPLCPSFPRLFDLVDATENEVAGVDAAGFESVNELCFHCKLCYNHCPYTPPHEWDVDFPALMRRHQVVRAERDGVPLARRLTTRTDLIGRIATRIPALARFANRNRLSRLLMEKTVGIHRDWVQPSYERETVGRWFARRGARDEGTNGHVVLFTTCSVDYSDAETGRAAVEVLERSGVRVDVQYDRCCGMPATDVGDLEGLRGHAEHNVERLLPFVEAGATVVVPGPSCSLLIKTEYPKLLRNEASRRVAEATRDLME
jgi:Fe-S oxidoreductase